MNKAVLPSLKAQRHSLKAQHHSPCEISRTSYLYMSVLVPKMSYFPIPNQPIQIAGDLISTTPSQHFPNGRINNAQPTQHNANLERLLPGANKPSCNNAAAPQERWRRRAKRPSYPRHCLWCLRRPVRTHLRLPLLPPQGAQLRRRRCQSFSSSKAHGSRVWVRHAEVPRAYVWILSDKEVS